MKTSIINDRHILASLSLIALLSGCGLNLIPPTPGASAKKSSTVGLPVTQFNVGDPIGPVDVPLVLNAATDIYGTGYTNYPAIKPYESSNTYKETIVINLQAELVKQFKYYTDNAGAVANYQAFTDRVLNDTGFQIKPITINLPNFGFTLNLFTGHLLKTITTSSGTQQKCVANILVIRPWRATNNGSLLTNASTSTVSFGCAQDIPDGGTIEINPAGNFMVYGGTIEDEPQNSIIMLDTSGNRLANDANGPIAAVLAEPSASPLIMPFTTSMQSIMRYSLGLGTADLINANAAEKYLESSGARIHVVTGEAADGSDAFGDRNNVLRAVAYFYDGGNGNVFKGVTYCSGQGTPHVSPGSSLPSWFDINFTTYFGDSNCSDYKINTLPNGVNSALRTMKSDLDAVAQKLGWLAYAILNQTGQNANGNITIKNLRGFGDVTITKNSNQPGPLFKINVGSGIIK